MDTPNAEIRRGLLYVLYRTLNETRSLALGGNSAQAAELTDAIETIPSELNNWRDDSLEAIRFNLETYHKKYPDTDEYTRHLTGEFVPERF